MQSTVLKRFESPDKTRSFENGSLKVVQMGAVEHVGMVVSGRAAVQMEDGTYHEMGAGDVFYVAPGHDSRVVGDEPYVSLHFMGADPYAHGAANT